jgi:mannose-1-phosphate guanylyltransferase
MDKNNYCVIMAGGVGSRFWPLSRSSTPKQFLDILGTGKTLLQQTFERFARVCPEENIFIVSNIEYDELIRVQLPGLSDFQIMLEPMRKNTAPCIAYANYRIKQINENANIIVAPSDHLILKENDFVGTLLDGLEFVENNDVLLTLGIHPSRPETGYGYIQVLNGLIDKNNPALRKVKTFTEKPDLDLAKVFVKSGEFYWNSGIFIWSLKSIQNAFEQYLSNVSILFNELATGLSPEDENEAILTAYSDARNISIDFGIMEKADNVYVLCADFGWTDLGTWSSLYEHSEKDRDKNAALGENIMTYDTKGCLVSVKSDKLVILQGLKDYIVVETDNALLICKMEEEQKIKQIVNDVKIRKGEKYI